MLEVLNDETARLLKAYGNHPSLVLLNATNEPAGHYQEQLPLWDKKWHDADPRRLYSDGTGRRGAWICAASGAWSTCATAPSALYLYRGFNVTGGRGPRGGSAPTTRERCRVFRSRCIGHEVGQWCAYPDFDVIKKFSGPATTFAGAPEPVKVPYMIPGNYKIMRDSAEAHGLLAKNKEFAHASGRFQVACYKEEIEASLRTPSYSGFEILDLHDYLGQGGALIGMLDAFWESKGYATAAEFRQWNNATVPLARLKDRVYTTDGHIRRGR